MSSSAKTPANKDLIDFSRMASHLGQKFMLMMIDGKYDEMVQRVKDECAKKDCPEWFREKSSVFLAYTDKNKKKVRAMSTKKEKNVKKKKSDSAGAPKKKKQKV